MQHEPAIREIDLREQPAPEPLRIALELADGLKAGEVIAVLTPCWPEPLFSALKQRGFSWHAAFDQDGGTRVLISRALVDGERCGTAHGGA